MEDICKSYLTDFESTFKLVEGQCEISKSALQKFVDATTEMIVVSGVPRPMLTPEVPASQYLACLYTYERAKKSLGVAATLKYPKTIVLKEDAH